MKKNLYAMWLLLVPMIGTAGPGQTAYTMPRTQVIPVHDSASDKQYELYIKLPENYAVDKNVSHPVIYFTDAVWQIEMLSSAAEFIMEDAILVGISWQKNLAEGTINDIGEYASRFSDYTIKASSDPERQAKYQFGQASQHLKFIRNDVIKYIEKNFQTDPSKRTYFGYSLGGLFGAYALAAQPDTFNNYIIGSPTLQNSNPLLEALNPDSAPLTQNPVNVYVSYGTLEQDRKAPIDTFTNMMKAKYGQNISIKTDEVEGNHQTAAPLTGVRSVSWLSRVTKNGESQ